MGPVLGDGHLVRLRCALTSAAAALLLACCALGLTAPTAGAQTTGPDDSADGMIFWLGCDEVAQLTDAELDEWKSRGVDGFVCMVGHLREMGGDPGLHSRSERKPRLRQLRPAA